MEAGSVRRQNATFNAGKITNAAYEINIQYKNIQTGMRPCVQVSPFSNAPECVTGADSPCHIIWKTVHPLLILQNKSLDSSLKLV